VKSSGSVPVLLAQPMAWDAEILIPEVSEWPHSEGQIPNGVWDGATINNAREPGAQPSDKSFLAQEPSG
jgi:hypothetical protein